jgi:type VI secretion system protein ImpA
VGYEDQLKSDKERANRESMLAEGKLPPETFDKAFNETPKAFYLTAERDLDAAIETVKKIEAFSDERLEGDAPSYQKLKAALTETRHVIHALLEKKRIKEPDPVEAAPAAAAAAPTEADGLPQLSSSFSNALAAEPADRRQAVASIAAAAAFLRKLEPQSPAPYLMLRGLRWGELRAAASQPDGLLASLALEAPPTELRQQIKRLALAGRWEELLEAGEQAIAIPGARAWLDLQRIEVAACDALGEEYHAIAAAIQSELRALLNDLPELLEATLLDETPAANPETRAWLESFRSTPTAAEPESGDDGEAGETADASGAPLWLAAAVDAYTLARQARAKGQDEKAFAILRAEIAKQRSGRQRFRRTMQLVEVLMAAGKEAIAQPLLEDLAAMIENHKLEAWEEPESIAADLGKLLRFCQRIQEDSSEKQKLFEQICRLDPVQALNVE